MKQLYYTYYCHSFYSRGVSNKITGSSGDVKWQLPFTNAIIILATDDPHQMTAF